MELDKASQIGISMGGAILITIFCLVAIYLAHKFDKEEQSKNE